MLPFVVGEPGGAEVSMTPEMVTAVVAKAGVFVSLTRRQQ